MKFPLQKNFYTIKKYYFMLESRKEQQRTHKFMKIASREKEALLSAIKFYCFAAHLMTNCCREENFDSVLGLDDVVRYSNRTAFPQDEIVRVKMTLN